jgi:hypothetical protein
MIPTEAGPADWRLKWADTERRLPFDDRAEDLLTLDGLSAPMPMHEASAGLRARVDARCIGPVS